MNELLPKAILFAGIGQLSVLVGSSLVPIRLHWREAFRSVPHLHRQMVWVYGGYTAVSIVALGMIALVNAQELANGSLLARSVCLYATVFWAVRLAT